GVVFVVTSVASTFLPGAPPASDASAAKVAAYFQDHTGAIKAQQLVGAVGIVALLWWAGALWRFLSRAEGGQPRLTVVAALSLVAGLALAMLNGVLNSTAAIRVDAANEFSHLLWSMSLV